MASIKTVDLRVFSCDSMPINKRQHLVSQFVIRQFLAGHDRLFCLDKLTLAIIDRVHGNLPADILKRAYYYTTDTDDFDGEIVKPLEDKLAPLCKGLSADHEVTAALPSVRDSLIDWCALSPTRGVYFGHVAPIAYETLSAEEKGDLPADQNAMTLVARRASFNLMREELCKARVIFRFLRPADGRSFLLTDYPPVPIPYSRRIGQIGPMLLPIAHDLMLIQVPEDLAPDFFSPT